MYKSPILFSFFLLVLFASCQKESVNNTNNNTTPTDYYITFDFDGTPVEYRTMAYQTQSSSGATVSGGIVNVDGGPLESIYVNINMDQDSITYNHLKSLVGQELGVCLSSSTICNDPIHINLRYDDGTEIWSGDATHNTLPAQSLTITSVEYSPTIGLGIGQLIIVSGEFNLVLEGRANNLTKTASNGQFRLQFPEYK